MTRPTTGYAYLDDVPGGHPVIAMAHRGGAAHPDLVGLENTTYAFQHAVELGYRYLETDVHLTADGQLIAFHDDVLDRVTDGTGPVATASAAQIASARIGETHPIPFLVDLLDEFADCRFNVDLKADGTPSVLVDLLDKLGAHDRVCVGSFSQHRIREFRIRAAGRVATSASPAEVGLFLAAPGGSIARRLTCGRVAALQVPHHRGALPVVNGALVRKAHAAGAQVHVWTVDDPEEMVELLDLGVDGLITDRTDLLKDLLVTRGLWEDRR